MDTAIVIPILLTLIIPLYWVLRINSAIDARQNFVDEVDEYLGNEKHPEELKLLVYHFFEECMDNLLPTKVWLYFVFFSNGRNSKHSLEKLKEKFGKDEIKEAFKLISKLMSVNVRLSPIQYILFGLTVLFFSIVSILFFLPGKAFDSMKIKTESALYRAIH